MNLHGNAQSQRERDARVGCTTPANSRVHDIALYGGDVGREQGSGGRRSASAREGVRLWELAALLLGTAGVDNAVEASRPSSCSGRCGGIDSSGSFSCPSRSRTVGHAVGRLLQERRVQRCGSTGSR